MLDRNINFSKDIYCKQSYNFEEVKFTKNCL